MKTLLQLVSLRVFSYPWLNVCNSTNQLRLSSVFFTNSQFSHCGSPCKHPKRPYILSTCSFRFENRSSKYYSVKVDTKDEGMPISEPAKDEPVNELKPGPDKPVINAATYDYVSEGYLNETGTSVLLKELKIMAKDTFRDEKKINEICNKLQIMDLEHSAKMNVAILYYLSVLNKPHVGILEKVLKNINLTIDDIYKPKPLITSVAKSLGSLLIRDEPTLDAIVNWYISKINDVDLSTAGEIIHSLAILNYFPPKTDILIKALIKSEPVEYSSNVKFLNFVWSLVLLDRAEPGLIQMALATKYRKKLEAILKPEARFPLYLKLNNIYAYAKNRNLSVKVDSGLYTSDTPWLLKLKAKHEKDTLAKSIIDALVNLLPPRTFRKFVEYESGCIIDALCYFNEDQQPEIEVQFMKHKKGTKLAILFLGFKELCLPDKTVPTGIIMFHKNYLEASGFKVVFVTFNEFPLMDNLKAKCEHLENKIRTVLPNFSVADW